MKCCKCNKELPKSSFPPANNALGCSPKCYDCLDGNHKKNRLISISETLPHSKPIKSQENNKKREEMAQRKRVQSRVYDKKRIRSPERLAAWRAVNSALKHGKLVKKPCEVCGCLDVQAHHKSYAPDKLLDVIWLCAKHPHPSTLEAGPTLLSPTP